jgi:predicted nucleotidyltransferase
MGRALGQTAARLLCSERTLRRYINDGLLRGHDLDGFRYELPAEEEHYALEHWDLLHGLRAAIRTERDVRLAVLFGSVATGEDSERSDVDLIVVCRYHDGRAIAALRQRLSDAISREVQIVRLDDAREAPGLLADVLAEGRVIVDRDRLWPGLRRELPDVIEAAEKEYEVRLQRAYANVAAARARLGRR